MEHFYHSEKVRTEDALDCWEREVVLLDESTSLAQESPLVDQDILFVSFHVAVFVHPQLAPDTVQHPGYIGAECLVAHTASVQLVVMAQSPGPQLLV